MIGGLGFQWLLVGVLLAAFAVTMATARSNGGALWLMFIAGLAAGLGGSIILGVQP